jgi:exodeoxyribonuclease VII small subunit
MAAQKSKPDPATANFETLVARLEHVVERLESGELPLEDALAVFEEGVGLARASTQRLDDAERRIERLLAVEDGVAAKPLAVPVPVKSEAP